MLRLLCGWVFVFAFLMPLTSWAKGVPIGEATAEQKESAKTGYVEGRTAFDEGRFQEAYDKFKSSYDIVASPNSHHMMAMALREMGKLAQAYEHFGEVAAEADAAAAVDEKYKKAAENARAKRDEVRNQIGFLNLAIDKEDDASSLTVNDRPIERNRWSGPIPANPGNTTVVIQTHAGKRHEKSVNVEAGGSHDLTFTIAVAIEPVGDDDDDDDDDGEGIEWVTPYRIAGYAAAGLGLVSFAIAGGLGSAAQSKHDQLADECGGVCPAEREDDISSGESLQVATNVMVVMGAVLVAGGVALWLVAPDARDGLLSDDGESDDDKPDDDPDFSLYVAPTPGGMTLGGTF